MASRVNARPACAFLQYHRRVRSQSRRWCAALLCAASLGCGSPGAFECQSDAQCGNGRCEPSGWCSFPDDACDSGSRYGGLAGDGLAGECVPVGGETETGTDGSEGPSTGPGTSSATTPATGEPVSAATSEPSTSDASTGSDDTPISCGDGTVDPDEQCDDGDNIDGDGCDTDCTPSGETIWEYVSNVGGNDNARDLFLGADGNIVVCGDGAVTETGDPYGAVFSPDGDLLTLAPIPGIGPGEAWGIAATDTLVAVGGRRTGPGVNDGFVAVESAVGMDITSFEVPMAVYDVAIGDDVVWVSGQLAGAPSVASYSVDGVVVDELDQTNGLPATGVAWDLALGSGSAMQAAGIDDNDGTAWIRSVSLDGGPGWQATWEMSPSGSAFGITRALDDTVIASGSSGASGMVAVFQLMDGSQRWAAELTAERGSFANIHKAAGGPSGEVVGVGWVATSGMDADIWIGKYSSEGELLWERTFAGTGATDSNGWSVAVDGDGSITAVGGIYNDPTGYDSWVVHLEP